MATIFRKTYTQPLPKGTEIVERRGKKVALWLDRRGRKHYEQITTGREGQIKITRESPTWMAQYRNANRKKLVVSTGCRDEQAARQVLANFVRRVEHIKSGILTPEQACQAAHAVKSLAGHIEDYLEHMRAKTVRGRKVSEKHRVEVERQLKMIARDRRLTKLTDISREAMEKWMNRQEEAGMGVRTRNTYRAAIMTFCNWCVETDRLAANPLAKLCTADETCDRRRTRRALTEDEVHRLLTTARLRPVAEFGRKSVRKPKAERKGKRTWYRAELTFEVLHAAAERGRRYLRDEPDRLAELERLGQERSLIYKTLVLTGLRKGELASLTVGQVELDTPRPYAEFLATGLNLSPFRLPFEPGLFEHTDRQFGPLPGLFDDSLPDGWGLLLMDRYFRSLGRNLAEVSPLDRLSWLGTRTMGALTYHPPADRKDTDASVFDLHDLAHQSREILTGDAVDVLPQLLRAGGSPGGARPKVLVGFNPDTNNVISGEDDLPDGFEHWIVKFAAEADTADAGAMEYAYSLMARDAGIDMPPTRLFETSEGDRFFGIKRFDRASSTENSLPSGNRRYHVHTFGNLIQSNFRIPSADYADLLKAASLLTRNHQDVLRVFRRMVFNVLSHNRDDHVKNFAFLLDDTTGDWTLSPAYDLLYTPGPGGEHTMTLAGEGRNPGRTHMLRLAGQADVSPREAAKIIDEVRAVIARWPAHAAEAGLSKATPQQIAKSLPDIE